jgi:hypothetical protein
MGLLLQVSLYVGQKPDDRRALFQFALEFGDQDQRFGVSVVQVENDERRFFLTVLLKLVGEILVGLTNSTARSSCGAVS